LCTISLAFFKTKKAIDILFTCHLKPYYYLFKSEVLFGAKSHQSFNEIYFWKSVIKQTISADVLTGKNTGKKTALKITH